MRLTRLLAAPLALTVTSLVGCASPPRPVDAELLLERFLTRYLDDQ